MPDLEVRTTTNGKAVLPEKTIEELEASFSGQLVRRENDDYDECRAVWNGMIDKQPALIARCTDMADVVKCARSYFEVFVDEACLAESLA